jgi:hypothetical protein
MAAEKEAKYGDPKWSWVPFGSFLTGKNYVTTGKVTLIDNDVQFSNGFGAMVHSTVRCIYNLNTKAVLDVFISER